MRGVPQSQRAAITCFVRRNKGEETKHQQTLVMKSASSLSHDLSTFKEDFCECEPVAELQMYRKKGVFFGRGG